MKYLVLMISILAASSSFGAGLYCDFHGPKIHERINLVTKAGAWSFDKSAGQFNYRIKFYDDQILSIEIKDTDKKIATSTSMTTLEGVSTHPKQLSLDSGRVHTQVYCQ